MRVEKTSLNGVMLIKPEIFEDFRGSFTETYNEKAYSEQGLTAKFLQDDVSVSYRNVLRGMHGDADTYKLIQCLYGRVYSVVVNCDETSGNFGKWEAFVLSDTNRHQLYIPPMYGNGYYVLSEMSVYTYKQSTYYSGNQFTYKWNDPRFNIKWPAKTPILSSRDE